MSVTDLEFKTNNNPNIYGYKEDFDNKFIYHVQRVVPRKTGTYTRHYTIFFGDFTPQKQKQYKYTTKQNFEYMSDKEALELIGLMFDEKIILSGNHIIEIN